MMKTASKIVLSLLAGVLIAGLSHSAFAAGNAGNRAIKKMIHPDSTKVLIVAEGKIWLNPDACDKSNQAVLASAQLANDKVYREMLAMLLSAHVSARRVELRTKDCVTINGTSYPSITQVTLL
jgi:hypothetical protein